MDATNASQRLVDLAQALGVGPEALDDAVHDLAQEIALGELNTIADSEGQEDHIQAQESFAAGVNNGGIESQIEFLLAHSSPEDVEALIRGAVNT